MRIFYLINEFDSNLIKSLNKKLITFKGGQKLSAHCIAASSPLELDPCFEFRILDLASMTIIFFNAFFIKLIIIIQAIKLSKLNCSPK